MSRTARSQVSGDRRLVLGLGGALVLALVILVVAVSNGSSSEAERGSMGAMVSGESEEMSDLSRRIDGDPTALGAADAPVVLIEYADYRCPFCAVFSREVLPPLIDEYVDDGLLRIEWRDLPIFGDESIDAAIAARAAAEQGLFWEYQSAIYDYPGRDKQPLPRERLLEIASDVGVPDLDAFETALDDPDLAALVMADAQEAAALGVRSTPTFLVGQVPVMGAQPLDAFRGVVESELDRLGR